ncbi:MAG: hypothetical protein JWP97_5275 [Labilithrix sp.]|nr:hypothetical protein [Labilithrix sp.]
MRSPTKDASDRRVAERRSEPSRGVEARRPEAGAVPGERRVVEQRKVGTAMVDALEDILKWERASERALRVAAVSGDVRDGRVTLGGAGGEASSATDRDARSN